MKHLLSFWIYIKGNSGRFAGEVTAVVFSALVGYGVSYIMSRTTLEACQDERAELLRQNTRSQSLIDSVKWSTVLATKNAQINQLQHENLKLRERAALDSAAAQSALQSMRAINQRYR